MEDGGYDGEGGEEGERQLRGSALYAQASLINHECNPNVARFDAFDAHAPSSTYVSFRAMHDLPQGARVFVCSCVCVCVCVCVCMCVCVCVIERERERERVCEWRIVDIELARWRPFALAAGARERACVRVAYR